VGGETKMETIRENRIMKKIRLFVVILSLLDVLLLSGVVLAEEKNMKKKNGGKTF
jgi:hypothetical protein